MNMTYAAFADFGKIFWSRFNQNKLLLEAGALTYSTMLAIVPLIMVFFSIFSAFPIFHDVTGVLKEFIFTNFAPSAGDIVGQYIDEFVQNSKKMSAVGIISLILVALMLIHSIDNSLNGIWRTPKRSTLFSFAVYWTILTLGPIIIGVSIAISTYVANLSPFRGELNLPFGIKLLSFVPFILTWLSFTLIYALVPNKKINMKHAAAGALVAAVFFTLGKKAFMWYITTFPSYQLIYGAMATLPLMLLWLQLSWLFILLGAQLAAVLDELPLIRAENFNSERIKDEK
ncbi:virulence factor BrkB family protein [Bisgaard Taxon 10/6]|uniref:virulence factor BrkB family protein n=1 Tax=Exercitatus varius TaxID=67857 RepID=UPI00294B4FC5|nr:virulence factor BrkB family protein [Exercitatus varius]MDG2960474.1 virulence factor BrkB family protein [Exercitatus varius]